MNDWGWILIIVLIFLSLSKKGTTQQLETAGTTNEEVWQWTDYKGREYQITVHRHVS